jgi:OmpA-OmpF porin, OOP family
MAHTKIVAAGSMTLLLGVATGAGAETSGPYIAVGVGANFRQESRLTLQGAGAEAARRLGMGTEGQLGFGGAGPAALGSLGWGFGTLRAEVEFSYRSDDVDALSVAGIPGRPSLSGSASTHAVMANLLYDLVPLRFQAGVPVTPYLGLGGGYAWSSYREIVMRSGMGGAATYGVDGRFAYQAIAGLSWDLSGVTSGLSLTTEYRYFAVVDQTVSFGAQLGRFGFRDAEVQATNRNHALLLGLRYAFWTPAP